MEEKHVMGAAKEQGGARGGERAAQEGSPERGIRAEEALPGPKGLSVDMPLKEEGACHVASFSVGSTESRASKGVLQQKWGWVLCASVCELRVVQI